MDIILEIIYNLGALAALGIFAGFLGHRGDNSLHKTIAQGLMFGFTAIMGMLHPLVLSPGLIFDGRSVMISLCGLFFGPLSAAIAAVMALMLRILQGGTGTIMGVCVIISSAIIGSMFYSRRIDKDQYIHLKTLYIMGLIIHVFMVLFMFTLPSDRALSTIKLMGLPVILVYPLATALIGWIISESGENRRITQALRNSKAELSTANQELENYTDKLIANEEELRSQYLRLAESEEGFRNIFENSADSILILDQDAIIDCNQAAAELLGGGSKNNLIYKKIWELSPEHQTNGELSKNKVKDILEKSMNNEICRFEWIHYKYDRSLISVEVVLTAIIRHGEKVIHALIRDISERKALEERLENMSYHDQLTGVYNRRFLEEELIRLNVKRNLPLTVIIGDVNGLKLVNDSFGHHIGDELLRKVSDLIKAGCREDDIIARFGGDEFVILLTQTDSDEAEIIVKRIQALAACEKVKSLEVSISFGWATKYNELEDINEALKKAEDYLYKKKLFESPSSRGKTIQTIIHTLHEKNKREEEHSRRVSFICEKMGISLGLPEAEIKELKTVGLLHDIGKIAIDEHMLNKPGKLTQDEWNQMTKHPEVGYRILSTVNEMSEIAEYVLAHHERWDGKGYPKGLKKEEIPFEARIISLADTYDAMTSDRPYRAALSHEIALNELRKNAGTQFDPDLVDVFLHMMA